MKLQSKEQTLPGGHPWGSAAPMSDLWSRLLVDLSREPEVWPLICHQPAVWSWINRPWVCFFFCEMSTNIIFPLRHRITVKPKWHKIRAWFKWSNRGYKRKTICTNFYSFFQSPTQPKLPTSTDLRAPDSQLLLQLHAVGENTGEMIMCWIWYITIIVIIIYNP